MILISNRKETLLRHLTILEIIYYLFLLMISFIIVQIHGIFLVNDGYYQIAEVIQKNLINYGSPSTYAYRLYSQRFPTFRPIYSLLIALFSSLIFVLTNYYIDMFYIGILINLISGFVGQYYFIKMLELFYTINSEQKRVIRILYVSYPTFIVFWLTFSVDMMFLASLSILSYYLMKIYLNKEKKILHFEFFLILIISVFIKEESIIMIISYCYIVLFNRRRNKIIFTIISWITGVLLFHIIYWRSQLNVYAFNYFYNNVYSFSMPNATFHFDKLGTSIYIYLSNMFGFHNLIQIGFSLLWSTGCSIIILFLYYFYQRKIDKKVKIFENGNILWIWTIGYILFILIVITNFISERYFLPFVIPLTLSLIMLKNKENLDNKFLFIIITGNILLIIFRMIFILTF